MVPPYARVEEAVVRFDSRTALARMAAARPTISAGCSPFIARPTSRPPICAGVARPAMISAIAAAASPVVRFWRRMSC